MYKKILIICLIVNVLAILASSVNYIYIVRPLSSDIANRLDESTADLAVKSADIISSYSEAEKIENIDKIIKLFRKVASYLDPLEEVVFESYETIILYSYFIFILSVFNFLSLMLIIIGVRVKTL